jgi:hypothetical protein
MQAGSTNTSTTKAESESRSRELSHRIRERAFGAGFEKVGIVPAQALDEEAQ